MVKLEDYLYHGDTIFKILGYYGNDIEEDAFFERDYVGLEHSHYINHVYEILEHNEFLTSQSQRMREFYNYMTRKYPYLAFTFKGRIKSVIRAEAKFNRVIVEYSYDYYMQHHRFPTAEEMKNKLSNIRDLIAYRIVISIPRCKIENREERKEKEIQLLYEIANTLPTFLQKYDFSPVEINTEGKTWAEALNPEYGKYYKDYIKNPTDTGYQSLHLGIYDNLSRCYAEFQLRTKEMDDWAEIGGANHQGYELSQKSNVDYRAKLPERECRFFDEAYDRLKSLEKIELSELDVNMFAALDNKRINDGCGLFYARQILPFEHLSKYQKEKEEAEEEKTE